MSKTIRLDDQLCFSIYAAGHAFNRDVDPDAYGKGSATLARARSLAFFAGHLR